MGIGFYIVLTGAFAVGIDFMTRLGYLKGWYFAQGIPVLMPSAVKYILLPLGCMLIAMGIIGSDLVPIEYSPLLFDWIVVPLFVFAIVLGMWQPAWLLPYWLRYLRKSYGHAMTERLLASVRFDPTWSKRVRTHEGLVAWAEEADANLDDAKPVAGLPDRATAGPQHILHNPI